MTARMSDDDILKEAERIKLRRLNQARLDSFFAKDKVMIRWDNPGAKFGESYTSIEVDMNLVGDIVAAHFAPLIAKRTEP